MGKPTLAHQVIGFNCTFNILFVYADRNAHIHMLRALYNHAIQFKQVRFFQGFKSKIIKAIIAVVNNGTV